MEYLVNFMAFKSTGSTAFAKPFETKFYIWMLNVTGSVKEKYEEFIKGKFILIRGTALN